MWLLIQIKGFLSFYILKKEMSQDKKEKIPVYTKEDKKKEGSKLRSVANIFADVAKTKLAQRFSRERRKIREIRRSVKITLGLLTAFLVLAILSLGVVFAAGLTWLVENTPLTENVSAFLIGTFVGYLAALIAAVIYSKYMD